MSCLLVYGDTENAGAAFHNLLQSRRVIVLQGALYAEPCSQRRSEKSAAGRSPNKRERVERKPDGPCPRTLVHHYVYDKILHSGVKILLNDRGKPVNLIDKKHIPFLQRGKQPRKVSRLIKHRT